MQNRDVIPVWLNALRNLFTATGRDYVQLTLAPCNAIPQDQGLTALSGKTMNVHASKDPLHGITLEMQVNSLVEQYGWPELSKRININCFKSDPSVKSSLKFLRRTPWARAEVEALYLASLSESEPDSAPPAADDPWANWRGDKT